jgi:dTMP kinase
VPLDVARSRLDATRNLDKFEQEKEAFFASTRAEYLRRAAQFPERFRIVDSSLAIQQVESVLDEILLIL